MGQRVAEKGCSQHERILQSTWGNRGGRQELHLDRQSDITLGDKGKAKAQWPHLLTGVGYC